MKTIKRTFGKLVDHAVLISAIILIMIYSLQMTGALSWWISSSWLIWRGGW